MKKKRYQQIKNMFSKFVCMNMFSKKEYVYIYMVYQGNKTRKTAIIIYSIKLATSSLVIKYTLLKNLHRLRKNFY